MENNLVMESHVNGGRNKVMEIEENILKSHGKVMNYAREVPIFPCL